MVSSLTFGLPPLVEYDTSHPVIRTRRVHAMEWIHGCPVEFAFSIIKINAWRAQNLNGTVAPNELWKEIEAAAWAWQPRGDYGPDCESSKLVARLATQEGWRHTVLIYLYMGMCGATSHDPRVQASAQQLCRLQGAMGPNLVVGVHFVIPLLLGAICTRSEAQRSRFRKAIMQAGDNKVWLSKSVRFASVLDHLWHGAAANGAAVTWEDYVNARKAVVRIDVL
ncbi:hypothetical protein FRC07_014013 [Ceratobasidium sp. 392]|nr:hypothetical protein FRC07_014013 [Ceratobasidium sp. 392]